MGKPRASRRKIAVSSDEEDDAEIAAPTTIASDENQPVKAPKRSTGKLKPVSKARKAQQPTPDVSTPDGSSQKSPAKAKVTKSNAKQAAKDSVKPNAKPIYSFFNAATQRQQSAHPTPSPEKPTTPHEALESIQDDSGDEAAMVAVSKGSTTALHLRKRKLQPSQSIGEDDGLLPPATQKFRKASDGGRTPSITVSNDDKRPWTEQFAPADLADLAVHNRKVADVRQWLETAEKGRRQKVLVLKGAAGTGKTTAVKLLARDMHLNVAEWRNPAGVEVTADGSLSSAAQFEEFLRRAGSTIGLALSTDGLSNDYHRNVAVERSDDKQEIQKQLLLIEEFPNTFSRTSSSLQSFRSAIMQYVSSPPVPAATPIVMIISETLLSTHTAAADSFTAHRLLGPELVNHPYVNMIEFNPVAPTILTKALNAIIVKEARKSGRRRAPGPQVLKRLAETGDIRSAISSLEFLCLRGDDASMWSSKVAFTKPKKAKAEEAMTQAEEDALKLVTNRESSLGIFHAVGRIVHNNRVEPPRGSPLAQPPSWLPQHCRMKVPERDIDSLIDELGTDTSTFLAGLHENYALSCPSSSAEETLDSLSACSDNISDADLLSVDRFSLGTRAFSGSATDSLRQDEMSFQVAVRGLLFNLPSPVHRGIPVGGNKAAAHRMFYPRSLRVWKAKEEIEGTLELLISRVQNGTSQMENIKQSAASASGVESWKRTSTLTQSTKPNATEPAAETDRLSLTKGEMLLERLPYMSIIRSEREDSLVNTVCRIRTSTAADDDEGEADPDINAVPEHWTTDKPDIESGVRTKGRQKPETEGGGLAIPVETSVEKLVLADDDIEDD